MSDLDAPRPGDTNSESQSDTDALPTQAASTPRGGDGASNAEAGSNGGAHASQSVSTTGNSKAETLSEVDSFPFRAAPTPGVVQSDSPPFFQADHARPEVVSRSLSPSLSDDSHSPVSNESGDEAAEDAADEATDGAADDDDTPDNDGDDDEDDIPRSNKRPLTHRARKMNPDAEEADEESDDEQVNDKRSNDAESQPEHLEEDDSTPITIDEAITRTLKASKRRSVTSDASSSGKKPKGSGRVKRPRDDDGASGSNIGDGRPRKLRRAAAGAKRKGKNANDDEKEEAEIIGPEEARAREIDRLIADVIKPNRGRRKKKDEIALDDEFEKEIGSLKVRMEKACVADNEAREAGRPAVHKLKMLPEVIALLNRNNVQDIVLDPETNFLQYVKYFLEPLNDGSLPAYSIQRDIFTALTKLPIEKEALLSSGIGKVIYFYVLSQRPEAVIKRMANRLMREWSRPILKRTDDYKKRRIETREYDYVAQQRALREAAILGTQYPAYSAPEQPHSTALTGTVTSRAEYVLEASQPPQLTTRTNNSFLNSLPASYTVAPRNIWDGSSQVDHRPIGAAGDEAFRKMLANLNKDKPGKEKLSKR